MSSGPEPVGAAITADTEERHADQPEQGAVEHYLDDFRRTGHAQILGCLTDDITWTVFGAFHLEGKAAYDAAIEGPGFAGSPGLEVVRIVEEGDTVMADLVGRVPQQGGSVQRLSMAEVFVLRDGLIRERRITGRRPDVTSGPAC